MSQQPQEAASSICTCIASSTVHLSPRVGDNHAQTWSGEEVDFASLTWISYAEQLQTDAAFMLDASTRVAAAAGSGLVDVHLHCVVDGAL